MTHFVAIANRAGKITATANKVAAVLNTMSPATLLGAALDGRGQIAKRARADQRSRAFTLDVLAQHVEAGECLDGGAWGQIRALLAARYGVTAIKAVDVVHADGRVTLENVNAKRGCALMLERECKRIELALLDDVTDKRYVSLSAALIDAQAMGSNIQTLIEWAETAAMAAQAEIDSLTAMQEEAALAS